MRYYKQLSEDNRLSAIGTGPGGVEITAEEYNSLLSEIRTKAELVDKLYSGTITIDEVPAEWQTEIQRRVDERKQWEAEAEETAEATEADYIAALSELGVIVNEEN